MPYRGFYINLDRRADLRADIEAELARHNLLPRYERFPAIDGNALNLANPHLKAGEMGCFSSHARLLEASVEEERHLHLIEDDILFAAAAPQAIDRLTQGDLFQDYDIVYSDVFVPLLNDAYKAYKTLYDAAVRRDANGTVTQAAFSVINLNGLLFGSTTSYFVNKASIRKVAALFSYELRHQPRQPVDLFIRRLANENILKVGCLFPFVTTVRLDHILETDISRDYHDVSALAAHLGRYSFYIDADHDKAQALLERCMPLPETTDKQTAILRHLLAFSLTDRYKAP